MHETHDEGHNGVTTANLIARLQKNLYRSSDLAKKRLCTNSPVYCCCKSVVCSRKKSSFRLIGTTFCMNHRSTWSTIRKIGRQLDMQMMWLIFCFQFLKREQMHWNESFDGPFIKYWLFMHNLILCVLCSYRSKIKMKSQILELIAAFALIGCSHGFLNGLRCSFQESVNITDGIHHANKTITFDGVNYPIHEYVDMDYDINSKLERIKVKPYIRGCLCNIRPCISLCCPYGSFGSEDNEGKSKCAEQEAAFKNVQIQIVNEESESVNVTLDQRFKYIQTKCAKNISYYLDEDYSIHYVSSSFHVCLISIVFLFHTIIIRNYRQESLLQQHWTVNSNYMIMITIALCLLP